MTCDHLSPLEKELIERNITLFYRGEAWSKKTREWAYFNCFFTDLNKTIERLKLDRNFIKTHSHFGTHDGQEHGFFCEVCLDGIMGLHPKASKSEIIFI